MTFFTTDCSIVCIGRLIDLADLTRQLPASVRDDVTVLAIEAGRDSNDASSFEDFGRLLGTQARSITFASVPNASAQRIMAAIGFVPQPRTPDRIPSTLFVFDRRGSLAMRYGGDPLDKRRVATDLATLARLPQGAGFDNHEVESPHVTSGDWQK